MPNSRHQYSLNWLVGINNDVWTNDNFYRSDESIIRGSFAQLPYLTNVKNIITPIHRGPVVILTNEGNIESVTWNNRVKLEDQVRNAFGIRINDDEHQWIIYHNRDKEVAIGYLNDDQLENINIIIDSAENIYPISIGTYDEGVHIIDSFIAEELDSGGNTWYSLTRSSEGGAMITSRLDIDSIILVKRSLILSKSYTNILREDGDDIIMISNPNPPNVKDVISYTSSSGSIEPLYILNDGRLVDKNSNLIGEGFNRFLFFEYAKGVIIVGNNQRTYRFDNNRLEDLNIPLVIG